MAATPWNTSLQDRDDNFFVVSLGELKQDNPPAFGGDGENSPDWFDELYNGLGMWGRSSEYAIQGVFGGEDPIAADGCAWSHVVIGSAAPDFIDQLWNTSGDDPDDTGSPVCRPLTLDLFAAEASNGGSSYGISYSSGTGGPTPLAPLLTASQSLGARAVWLRKAMENLTPWGVLPTFLDPVADGVPPEFAGVAELEWEDPVAALVAVDVTPDRAGDRDTPVDYGNGSTIFLNDQVLPNMASDYLTTWRIGTAAANPDDTGRDWIVMNWNSGDPDWEPIPYITSWDDCQPTDGSAPWPDISVGIAATGALSKPAVNEGGGNSDELAIRLTLRCPRYRWLYPGANPAIRQYPRDDGKGISSAPRLHPPTKANRLVGGYM